MYKLIKDISQDNFLFGGLIYHHKEIIDPEKREEEFNKMIARELGEEKVTKEVKDFEIEDIYSLAALLKNAKSSQSLGQYAMEKTMKYFGNESEPYPIDTIYDSKEHSNAFIDNKVKILDSDKIIFISMKGVIGGVYDTGCEKQRLGIMYRFDEDLNIYIGEVFDLKLYEDFMDYKKYIGDLR